MKNILLIYSLEDEHLVNIAKHRLPVGMGKLQCNFQKARIERFLEEDGTAGAKAEELSAIIAAADAVIIFLNATIVASEYLDQVVADYCGQYPDQLVLVYSRTCYLSALSWTQKASIYSYNGNPIASLKLVEQEQVLLEVGQYINYLFIPEAARQPQEDQITKVFISYSSKDGHFADYLTYRLTEQGYDVKIDVDYLVPGVEWRQSIDIAISDSDLLIVIVSENANNSQYVTYEWAYAMGKEIPVLPVLIEGRSQMKIHPKLRDIENAIGLLQRKNSNWEGFFEQLQAALKYHVSSRKKS